MPGGEIAAIVTAVLAGLGSLVVAMVNARTQARKTELDVVSSLVETMRCQVADQQKQITNLQAENNALHEADNALREENRILRGKVESQALEILALRRENEDLRAEVESYRKPKKKDTGGL